VLNINTQETVQQYMGWQVYILLKTH